MTLMTHPKPQNSIDKFVLLSIYAATFSIAACTNTTTKPEQLSEAQACTHLNELIGDHPNHFDNIKKNLTPSRRLSVWAADKLFPTADNCQVWEWGAGLFNYACEWKTGNDEQKAIDNYQYGIDTIQNCLGEQWTAQTNTTESGGKHTRFSSPDTQTMISVRYFKEQRGWPTSWLNTFIIGDRSNLQTPLQ
ncbi:MAG: hypothetical protein IBX56_14700 [Methylomicrobium sp.]|nr:hypothetical protein [Methylomicrobium sp.]